MIAKKSADRPLSKGIETDFKRANILDFLDKLKPSTEGKYFCPACGGDGLSITKEGKDAGDTMCWSNDCSWESIMDNFVALDPSPKATTRPKTTTKFKSSGKRDKAAISTEITIDSKITELVFAVENDSSTPARASVALAAWCKEHGHNGFTAGRLLTEKLRSLKQATGYDDDELTPKLLRDFNKIDKVFSDRLRYNLLFKEVELDGVHFDPASSKIDFVVDHGLKLTSGRDDVSDCAFKIARRNEYHPIREYLEQVSTTHGTDDKILRGFASRYLGTDEKIHQIAVIKFLISAVARIYEPGCQVDTALILQGIQGLFKSGFFRVLASAEWFDDSMGNSGDKDERLKLHCSWILEWAELESIFKRKDMSQVKAFLTTKIDKLRPPYGRSIEFMARQSVFCGTTNEKEFLADSTGNRRFWVVPIKKQIDVRLLEKERDQIWAAVVALYKSGTPWHLTTEESAEMDKARRSFESSDVWEDEILDWLETREKTSMAQILETLLGIETNQQDKKAQLRVRGILTRANWQQADHPSLFDGKRTRVWTKK
jgi:predicted P-loop ATPase